MIPNWVTQPIIKPQGRRSAWRKSLGVNPAPKPNIITNTIITSSISSNGVTTSCSETSACAAINRDANFIRHLSGFGLKRRLVLLCVTLVEEFFQLDFLAIH